MKNVLVETLMVEELIRFPLNVICSRHSIVSMASIIYEQMVVCS